MNKSIKLTGLSTNPSDYGCADGNLSSAINVVHDNGDITQVFSKSPKLLSNLGDASVIYNHYVNDSHNLIVKKDEKVYSCKLEEIDSFNVGTYKTINAKTEYEISRYSDFSEILSIVEDGGSLRIPYELSSYDVYIRPVIHLQVNGTYVSVELDTLLLNNEDILSIGYHKDKSSTKNKIYYSCASFVYEGRTLWAIGGFIFNNEYPSVDKISSEIITGKISSTSKDTITLQFTTDDSSHQLRYRVFEGYYDYTVSGSTLITQGKDTTFSAGDSYLIWDTSNAQESSFVMTISAGTTTKYEDSIYKDVKFPYTSNGYPIYLSGKCQEFVELEDKEIVGISSVGNIIIFVIEGNELYYLYSKDTYDYKYLGDHMPELHMKFGLKRVCNVARNNIEYNQEWQYSICSYLFSSENEEIDEEDVWEDSYYKKPAFIHETQLNSSDNAINWKFNDDNVSIITENVMGAVNKFVAHNKEYGRFTQPFFVCFAYELYDGTTTMNSFPVLMIPSNSPNPICVIDRIGLPGYSNKTFDFHVEGFGCSIDYSAAEECIKELYKWRDIIKYVNVYVSSQIYTYDPSGKVKNYGHESTIDYLNNKKTISNGETGRKDGLNNLLTSTVYRSSTFGDLICDGKVTEYSTNDDGISTHIKSNVGLCFDGIFAELPEKDDEIVKKEIEECSNFYLVKQIRIDELKSDMTDLGIEKGRLTSLETYDSLDGEYQSHDRIVCSNISSYNNRIIRYNSRRFLNDDIKISDLIPYQNDSSTCDYRIRIDYLNGKEIMISTETETLPNNVVIPYLYYHDPNIRFFEISKIEGSTKTVYLKEAHEHQFLNGSVCSCKLPNVDVREDNVEVGNYEYEYEGSDNSIELNNYIYTSEVDNPFVFKAANVESVGNGNIISLVPQAIALSQGQFGEYPMMCFTTDGIWALSVNETGGWSAKQPFSRDVVLNEDPDNILQMDRQVMFASNRGLMLISGSNVECISEVFDGNKDSFGVYSSSTSYKDGADFITTFLLPLTDVLSTRSDANKNNLFPDFKSFIGDATFLYDYTHQRIIIGNKSYPFSFVYNIKDKLWTAICQKITSYVNSYPNCYAMTKIGSDGNESNLLVDFAATDGVASQVGLPTEGFILTRPIKLDDADVMKTITKVIARGNMKNSSVDLVLLGSRNIIDWVIVGSCVGNCLSLRHGTAYKYFRIGVITKLGENESLSSLDVEYEVKLDNKMR